MKNPKTTLFTMAFISVAQFAFARGFGDRSSDTSQDVRAGSRGTVVSGGQDTPRASRTSGQDQSGSRAAAGFSRGDSAPVNVAQAPSVTPRSVPSPVTAYTAAPERRSSGAFSGADAARATPPPQVRTYTAPRVVADNSGAAPSRFRAEDTPRTTVVREAPIRTVADTPRTTVQTKPPLVASDDNARNSGTARGMFQGRQDNIASVTPTVPRRTTAADLQRTPAPTPIERTQPRVMTERTQTTPQAPIFSSQPRSANTALTMAPADNTDRTISRNTGNQPVLSRATTRGSDATSSARQQARDLSVASNDPTTTRSGFQRIAAPDTRLSSTATGRGTSASSMRFGSASDNMRPRTASLSPDNPSTRSTRRSADDVRSGNRVIAGAIPSHIEGGRDFSASNRRPTQNSRYGDGRPSVYRAPDRNDHMNRQGWFPPQTEHRNTYYGGHNSHDYDHHDYDYPYSHHAFSPVWCGPVVYPASRCFGFSWSNGSYGLSFASYSPAYAYNTRYYDSWSCGGWGYSDVYYGGWNNNWYGGFSYVYNPWPVYRTCYLYDPAPVVVYESAPVVTRTETVYVTEPATTSYVVQNTGAAPALQQPAATVTETQQTVWAAAPAVERAETGATSCFCPCHCNGQRPCTCNYPCGAEYSVSADQLNLSLGYSSYAETLNPETIWTSYAGLDRWDAYTEPQLLDATASTDTARH